MSPSINPWHPFNNQSINPFVNTSNSSTSQPIIIGRYSNPFVNASKFVIQSANRNRSIHQSFYINPFMLIGAIRQPVSQSKWINPCIRFINELIIPSCSLNSPPTAHPIYYQLPRRDTQLNQSICLWTTNQRSNGCRRPWINTLINRAFSTSHPHPVCYFYRGVSAN